ncbi:TIR domain-containing protein [Prosthecobacter fluviatilis]|uniref:TIR domain-containing protein n=1 Tax=Prosthecobacter fluviatilis TaxID=445931 RepID=A0ABW0KV35_9BACT
MTGTSSDKVHFFISYTGVDQGWAEWIAWQLEQAGQRTLIQAWDFKSGGVFPGDMHRALQQSARVIAVLSPAYMESGFCQPEWQAAFADDPTGEKGVLVCVRVADFKPDGLLRGRTYIDLVGLTEEKARARLMERLDHKRAVPASAPGFPPAAVAAAPAGVTAAPPAFPGSPPFSIPHNLPALQPFFGREEELGQIAVALEPESRTWGALIDGPGGMGKTSLAVRAAFSVKPGAFDRIVFVSLKSRELDDEGLRDLSGFILSGLTELLGELARELGRDDILKQAEEQRPLLLLEALRGSRALLILDNLESLLKKERDIVFTFVKRLPAGCKAILTCRGRIGSGAEELILGKLNEDAALATLAELATHNRELAKTSEAERLVLYRETGGAPLLLRWTAGQIGRGHCLTFTDAIEYLRSCPKGNDPLEFVFGDLAADFSVAETLALCALTFFTLAVSVEHIAALVNPMPAEREERTAARAAFYHALKKPMPVDTDDAIKGQSFSEIEIDRALRSLANRSLVIPSTELQRFSLVPLVADFLRKHKPEVIAATGNRLEQRALTLILENGFRNHGNFPTLETAWPGIAPALPLFLAGPNDRLQRVCLALDDFLDFTGRWDEWLALGTQAEARAIAAGDYQWAGWRAYQAGWVHRLHEQAEAVSACADRAASHWQKAFPTCDARREGIRVRAFALRLRGIGLELQKDYIAAIAAYHQVVELFRSLATASEDVALALNSLASVEQLSGDLEAAERDFREALHVANVAGYAEGVAYCTGNLALLAMTREDWPLAERLARESLALSEKVGRLELIAMDSRRIAVALARQGSKAAALPYAHRAVEIFTRLGSPDLAGAQAALKLCENDVVD